MKNNFNWNTFRKTLTRINCNCFHKCYKKEKLSKFYKFPKKGAMDFDPSKDYYKVLGLDSKASEKDIKIAYHKLAKKYHPDLNKGKTTEEFKEMSAAYDILSDSSKKRQYDEYRDLNFSDKSNYNPFHKTNWDTRDHNKSQEYRHGSSIEGFNQSFYSKKTTYSFRDPKTGEFKSYTYHGDVKGNPFYKDFEDFFKNFNAKDPRYNNRYYQREEHKENPFKDSFHDPYSNFRSEQSDKNFRKDNLNPQWSDADYFNYIYAKKIFRNCLILTFLMWILMSRRRRQEAYYDDYFYGNIPTDYSRTPYPPNSISQAELNNRRLHSDDPYVNPLYPVGLKK
jgi:curved DNA-binding protein CbpA